MEENKKLTKREKYEMIKELLEITENENKIDLIDFVEHQIEMLDSKAEKAKERAAERKIEGDALRDRVQSVITNEFQSAVDITAQVQDDNDEEEISKAKVIARLTSLVNNGIVVKEKIKTEDKKEVTVYKLA